MGFLRKAGGVDVASSPNAAEAGAATGTGDGGDACSVLLMLDCVVGGVEVEDDEVGEGM